MTEYERRAMGLLGEKHIGRMLLFRPSEELYCGLVRLGAACEVFGEAEELLAERAISGEYVCMLIGSLPELVDDPLSLFSRLRRHLKTEGALVAVSERYPAEEIVELLKEAKFRDICFDRVGEALLYRAQCLMSKTISLKAQFTPELRHRLLYLLRRVETGIDTDKNAQAVWELCEREKVGAEFLLPFIENTMIDPQRVLLRLKKSLEG